MSYKRECFGTSLDDQRFLKWLSKEVDYKLYHLKNLVSSKPRSNRKSYPVPQQEVYDFWVQNSITSNDSTNSSKRASKMSFFRDFKEITDDNVREEEKTRKKGSKVKMIVATKRIYTDSVRTLHKRFNGDQEHPISLTAFFKCKPFHVLKPREKEKQGCLCIHCLNPHVILKVINTFRISRKLALHDSLTGYLKKLETDDTFDEIDATNNCKYYKRIEETYIGKSGRKMEYTRTARVDLCEPVSQLVEKLHGLTEKYLKHRIYVDNYSSVFPLLKESCSYKFIELDFSQNLSLRPKDEVQSSHLSGKQFTLHCAIVEPDQYRYHYHISDDTKHDRFFVDYVVRDIIARYNITDEDFKIQSDNAPTQYKNKHAFSLYQKLADDFNLYIIRTYGASGHGKGVIDAMSSFGAKNILTQLWKLSLNTMLHILPKK